MSVNLPLLDVSSVSSELGELPAVPVPAGDPTPATEARGVVWAASAVLVGYPGDDLVAALPGLEAALLEVTPAVGAAASDPLLRVVAWLRSRPLLAAQQHYVATFDTRRRCCPYLTYYLHGDTRRRGLALWRVKAALAGCGVEPADGELPDHLAVLAELAATGDESVAMTLIGEHRAGLTLLRAALDQAGSVYADVVEAVEALLPVEPGAGRAAARLAASGPPAETVGLVGRLAPFIRGGAPADGTSADERGVRR